MNDAMLAITPLSGSKRAIGEFAERLAEQFGFGPGDAIEPLVRRLGGGIRTLNDCDPPVASMTARTLSDFTIYVHGMVSPRRNRSIVAQELGRLLLHFPDFSRRHPGIEMKGTPRTGEDPRVERETIWFAAGFLTPATAFRAAYLETDGDLHWIANRFAVTRSAAERRAKELMPVPRTDARPR